MLELDKNWFCNAPLDFEMKQYILLDYLQKVNQLFKENRIYPYYNSLLAQYQVLLSYNSNLQNLKNEFNKEIVGVDLKSNSLIYREQQLESLETNYLSNIIDFALPKLKNSIELGKSKIETISDKIYLKSIGIIPIYREEGYLIIEQEKTYL